MPEANLQARLHDGSTIAVEVHGAGPAVLLPVNPPPVEGPQAEAMRAWGADPALGHSLIDGLSDAFRVVAFDYEGHVLAMPKPDTLTPAQRRPRPAGRRRRRRRRPVRLLRLLLARARRPAARHPHRPAVGAGHGRFPTARRPVRARCCGSPWRPTRWRSPARPRRPAPRTTRHASAQPSDQPPEEPDWSQVEMTLTEDRRPASSSPCTRRCRTSTTAPPSRAHLPPAVLRRLRRRHRLRRAVGRRHGRTSPARSSAGAPNSKRSAGTSASSTGRTTSRRCRPPVVPVLRPWLVSNLG